MEFTLDKEGLRNLIIKSDLSPPSPFPQFALIRSIEKDFISVSRITNGKISRGSPLKIPLKLVKNLDLEKDKIISLDKELRKKMLILYRRNRLPKVGVTFFVRKIENGFVYVSQVVNGTPQKGKPRKLLLEAISHLVDEESFEPVKTVKKVVLHKKAAKKAKKADLEQEQEQEREPETLLEPVDPLLEAEKKERTGKLIKKFENEGLAYSADDDW